MVSAQLRAAAVPFWCEQINFFCHLGGIYLSVFYFVNYAQEFVFFLWSPSFIALGGLGVHCSDCEAMLSCKIIV